MKKIIALVCAMGIVAGANAQVKLTEKAQNLSSAAASVKVPESVVKRISPATAAKEATWWDTIMTYANGQWTNYDEQKIAKQLNAYYIQDALNLAVDPNDPTHTYVAYYGEGILELKNDTVLNWFNLTNSPLETTTGNNKRYIRIGSSKANLKDYHKIKIN